MNCSICLWPRSSASEPPRAPQTYGSICASASSGWNRTGGGSIVAGKRKAAMWRKDARRAAQMHLPDSAARLNRESDNGLSR